MLSKYNVLVAQVVIFTTILCCWASTNIDEKTNVSMMKDDKVEDVLAVDDRNEKNFNYLRLSDGECYNCSTYKCTNAKGNLGGSEWCIMLFPDAIAHCNSDVNCGGYTMSTAEWFHKKYDKNGQIAVHLTKANEQIIPCPVAEWSSYEKQKSVRTSPLLYGRSTCENSGNEDTCKKLNNFKYVFVNISYATSNGAPYSCDKYSQNIDKKDSRCILPIADGVTVCNSDEKCEGFMINTDENWQKNFMSNGMQSVELFGKGATYVPSQTWRMFKKQY